MPALPLPWADMFWPLRGGTAIAPQMQTAEDVRYASRRQSGAVQLGSASQFSRPCRKKRVTAGMNWADNLNPPACGPLSNPPGAGAMPIQTGILDNLLGLISGQAVIYSLPVERARAISSPIFGAKWLWQE